MKNPNNKSKKAKIILPVICCILIAGFLAFFFLYLKPNKSYTEAVAMMETHNYLDAKTKLDSIPNFKDSSALSIECTYGYASDCLLGQKYDEAVSVFTELGEYKDSPSLLEKSKYGQAETAYENKDYKKVFIILDDIPNYELTESLRTKATYALAIIDFESEKYEEALETFKDLLEYEEASSYAAKCIIAITNTLDEEDYEGRLASLHTAIDLGCDIEEEWESLCGEIYDLAIEQFNRDAFGTSQKTFEMLALYEYKDSVGKVSKCQMLIDTLKSAYHGTWYSYGLGVTMTFDGDTISYHTNSDSTEIALSEVNYDADINSFYFKANGTFHTKITGNTLVIKNDDGKGVNLKGSYQKYLDEEHKTTLSTIKPIAVIPMQD